MEKKKRLKSDGFGFKLIEEILYIFYIIIGFYIAFLLRFDLHPSPVNIDPYFDSIPYIIIVSIITFYIYDIVYTLKKSLFENTLIIAISLIIIDMAAVAIVFFNRGFAFPRSVFIIGFVIQFVLIFVSKLIILQILKIKIKENKVLIIANREEAEYIAKKVLSDKFRRDKIKYITTEVNSKTYELIEQVHKVFIGSEIEKDVKEEIINFASEQGIAIYLVPSIFEISLVDFKITQVHDLLVFKLEDLGLTAEQIFLKRIMDLIISIVGLLIVSPILIVTAIIIKLYDRGPVFFKQERVTAFDKKFYVYKFRTMIVDAEKLTGPVLATDVDPRITPLGRFLRASRIDEFPQLINVLKGEMSIVGPRPERPFFVEQFNKEVKGFKYRTFVKAGITGLAQVLGRYSTTPETKVKYDLLYIKNYSLFLDIKIMFNTLKTLFIRESARGLTEDRKFSEMLNEINSRVGENSGVIEIE